MEKETKIAQCFVCLKAVQIPKDSPKGMVVCDNCYTKTKQEFNDKKKDDAKRNR